MDQFTEVVSRGWLSRIGGLIISLPFGILFAIVAFPLLWWNEGRAVQTYRSLQEGAATVVEARADVISPANAGKLVHVWGVATTQEIVQDPTFGVSAPALRVRRKVEMYQWIERISSHTRKTFGGGEETVRTYSYDPAWRDDVVRSSGFKDVYGHENPVAMAYTSATFAAANVTMGAFTLPPGLVSRIDDAQPLAVPAAALATLNHEPPAQPALQDPAGRRRGKGRHARSTPAPRLAQLVGHGPRFSLNGDGLYYGANPARPTIGDLRVSFAQTLPGPVSVIAAQRGSSFGPYAAAAGDSIFMLKQGFVAAPAMFAAAQTTNAIITWLVRVGGFLLLFFGIRMVFRPLVMVADVVPFLGSIVGFGVGLIAFGISAFLSMLVIAIAWIAHRPAVGIALLIGGALLVLAVRSLGKKRSPRFAAAA